MDPVRFIHSADLHLGKRFARYPEEIRGRLIEARHNILGRLARAAREAGAAHVLLAGDIFDTETPSRRIWQQAIAAMAADAEVHWWLLPGNHDSLAAEALWDSIAAQAPANVHLLTTSEAVELAPGAMLLPAPLPRRRPGRDLTAVIGETPTPDGVLRIGLAHGPILDFSEDGQAADEIIAPDRADQAGLDYLALGDWHGQMCINARTWYSGTPERDGFRHEGRGACLAVTLDGPAVEPEIRPVEIGQFHWQESALALLPGQDAALVLRDALPPDRRARRDHLLRLRATGRASLAGQAALHVAADEVEGDFGHFEFVTDALATEFEQADLDAIDRVGALRIAAEKLAASARDAEGSAESRRLAEAALNRLYSYLMEERE